MAAGLLSLAAFLVHEARTPSPMMPLRLFAVRNFGWGNLATTAIYGALSLGFFVLGLYLQQVAGLGATAAGLALLPPTLMLLLLSSRAGALAGRFGPRWFMAGGPVLCAAGFVLMMNVGVPLDYAAQILAGLLVFGLGLSLTVAPLTAAILGAVKPEEAGIGSAREQCSGAHRGPRGDRLRRRRSRDRRSRRRACTGPWPSRRPCSSPAH